MDLLNQIKWLFRPTVVGSGVLLGLLLAALVATTRLHGGS
jgi:hypothetical protein